GGCSTLCRQACRARSCDAGRSGSDGRNTDGLSRQPAFGHLPSVAGAGRRYPPGADVAAAILDMLLDRLLAVVIQPAPDADLVDGAIAAFAPAGNGADAADIDAGRGDGHRSARLRLCGSGTLWDQGS